LDVIARKAQGGSRLQGTARGKISRGSRAEPFLGKSQSQRPRRRQQFKITEGAEKTEDAERVMTGEGYN
jgi:hypothetical protein